MNRVRINDGSEYVIEKDKDGNIIFENSAVEFEKMVIRENLFHIISESKCYTVEVLNFDAESKEAEFKINGENIKAKLKDKFDVLLEKLGMHDVSAKKVNEIKAPMPGSVMKILVKEGEEVQKDMPILILEAMKMENILKSPIDGIIEKINTQEGQNVEKNQKLVEFKA